MRTRLLLALLAVPIAQAQTGWTMRPADVAAVTLDVLKPLDVPPLLLVAEDGALFEEAEVGPLTGALALSARVPVSQRLAVDAQLPLALLTYESQGQTVNSAAASGSRFGVGNPYLGVAWAAVMGPTAVTVEGGVRLPLSTADYSEGEGPEVAWAFAAPEQAEGFLPDLASVRAALRVRQRLADERFGVEGYVAPVYGLSTVEHRFRTGGGDPPTIRVRPEYVVVGYGALATARLGRLGAAAGLIGQADVDTDAYGAFGTTALVARASLMGAVRPALTVRHGVGDRRGTTVGLSVSADL